MPDKTWRRHSCLQRRDSSRRSGTLGAPSQECQDESRPRQAGVPHKWCPIGVKIRPRQDRRSSSTRRGAGFSLLARHSCRASSSWTKTAEMSLGAADTSVRATFLRKARGSWEGLILTPMPLGPPTPWSASSIRQPTESIEEAGPGCPAQASGPAPPDFRRHYETMRHRAGVPAPHHRVHPCSSVAIQSFPGVTHAR